jgi:hypothetical protein
MDETIREHILMLRSVTDRLTAGLLDAGSIAEQQQIEGKLRAIDAAIAHFHAALEIESLLDHGSLLTAAA